MQKVRAATGRPPDESGSTLARSNASATCRAEGGGEVTRFTGVRTGKRSWLETKEDIVRLADRRDELLAVLNAKYGGYGAEDLEKPSFEAVNLSAQY